MCMSACRDQKLILVSSSVSPHLIYQGRVHLNPELTCPADVDGQLALGIHLFSWALWSQAGCSTCLTLTWGLQTLTPVPKLTF